MKRNLGIIALLAAIAWGGQRFGGSLVDWWNTTEVWIYHHEMVGQHLADDDYSFFLEGWWSNKGQLYVCTVSPEFYKAVVYTEMHGGYALPANKCREVLP